LKKIENIEQLTPEFVRENGLILFTIRALYRHNKILVLFINEEGEIYELLVPFKAKFWIHYDSNIINNDYIIEKSELKGMKWVEYDCYDINVYKTLKQIINKAQRGTL